MKKTSVFVEIIKDSKIEILYLFFLLVSFFFHIFLTIQILKELNHWLRYKKPFKYIKTQKA